MGIVDKGLGKTDLALRPDIWNVTTNEMYEIKPATQGCKPAIEQLGTYITLAAKYGKPGVYAGSSSAKEVEGDFMLNSATYVQYWSPRPGVILYSKTKIQKPQFDTGLNFNPQTGLVIGILIVGLAVSLYTGIPVFSY